MTLPTLLLGPMLRRVEPRRVCVFVATSAPARVRAEIFDLGRQATGDPAPIGSGEAESLQLGERLYVHLVSAHPDRDSFPADRLLAYDLELDSSDAAGVQRLGSLGLLSGRGRITYGDLALPTFFIRHRIEALNLLHGSCRLLHGKGEDGLLSADEVMAADARDLRKRPSALLLTGDQIYGDEVAGPLIRHLTKLGSQLRGADDEVSVPGMPALSTIPVYGRQDLVAEHAAFTSGKAANHILSFGEFAAMYLTAWNEKTWPAFPSAEEAIPATAGRRLEVTKLRHRYATELGNLLEARRAIPAVRRLFANLPTYMIFDDHDVTDDWNLTAGWRDRVQASPSGRRAVANALATFWAFQGWGNDPELFGDDFKQTVTGFLAAEPTVDGAQFDTSLWSFAGWSFAAPTDPPTIMLDTRTQRSFDDGEDAARLLGPAERQRVHRLCRNAGHQSGEPLILVSAVPVFGLELQERRQKFLVDKVGPYEIDFEAWHSNLAGMVDFMRLLTDDLGLTSCVLLSGDVHYGLNVQADFAVGRRRVSVAQLVSSSLKHSGMASRIVLQLVGNIGTPFHARLGWDRPPTANRRSGLRQHLLTRAANTDEWDEDSPVFLAPSLAAHLNLDRPPDYRESRRYLRPAEGGPSPLIGENNIGLVSYHGNAVVHRLLGRGRRGMRVSTVTFPLAAQPS
jgi:hypothetical protein